MVRSTASVATRTGSPIAASQFGQPVPVPARTEHRHARLGELDGAAEADPAAGARHDRYLHRRMSPFVSVARDLVFEDFPGIVLGQRVPS